MTNTEAYRQIVENVNAGRDQATKYRDMGTRAKWSRSGHDDKQIVLESIGLTLETGPVSKRQAAREDGKPPDSGDVTRVSQQILSYFAAPAKVH